MVDGPMAMAIALTATGLKPMEMVTDPIMAMVAGRVARRKMRTTGSGDSAQHSDKRILPMKHGSMRRRPT